MSDFVLDNSVTMRWCFDSGNDAYADQILDRLATGIAVAAVPPLWRYEVSSVLPRAEIKGWLTPQTAREFVRNLASLDIR